MSTLKDDAELINSLGELRETNARLLRDNSRLRKDRDELVAAVQKAIADNVRSIVYQPIAPPPKETRKGTEEVAIVTFSDLQLGQRTPTYDSAIAESRVAAYGDKVLRLVELQRSEHPIRTCRLYLLGDLVENEQLFPAQPWQVDSSLYAQVALNGPRILGDFIRRLLGSFEEVRVVSVPGNHGDTGGGGRKFANPETNFDRLLTSIVRQVFEAAGEKRVSFVIPEGFGRSSWYAVDYVGEHGFMLWHGHQARRTSSSSHLPFYKLVMGWRSGAIPEPFDVSICGHHHTPTFLTMNGVHHFINGTFASDADYAIERLASNSRAAQWLLFASPNRGLTAQYLVDFT